MPSSVAAARRKPRSDADLPPFEGPQTPPVGLPVRCTQIGRQASPTVRETCVPVARRSRMKGLNSRRPDLASDQASDSRSKFMMIQRAYRSTDHQSPRWVGSDIRHSSRPVLRGDAVFWRQSAVPERRFGVLAGRRLQPSLVAGRASLGLSAAHALRNVTSGSRTNLRETAARKRSGRRTATWR